MSPLSRLSLADGAGHILTIVTSFRPVSPSGSGPPVDAVGVGHMGFLTSSAKTFPPFPFGLLPGLPARGVGQNPDPLSTVWGAGVVCSHNTPSRIIPHLGKVTEDSGKSSVNKHW